MEISKDEVIFTSIDKMKILMTDTNQLKIHIANDNGIWSENEFNNFINSLRFSYNEEIKDEFLEVKNDDGVTLTVNKMKNILLYSNTNNYKLTEHTWTKNILNVSEKISDLFDVNLDFSIYERTDEAEVDDWDEQLKTFKLIKEFYYDIADGIVAIGRVIKDNTNKFTSMKKCKFINIYYEFELVVLKTDNILESIIKTIQALFLSKVVLTKKQQALVLEDYRKLVDIKKNNQNKQEDTNVYLLTPKPVALKKINLANPDNYGVVSILRGYTVTEKADGERILLYINNQGKVYSIDSSKRVEGTGIIAKKGAYNSLIDGEYIHCNKRIDGVKRNLFASFDIYFLNGEKLTSLPLIDAKNKNRYNEMQKLTKLLDVSKSSIDFMVKEHKYSGEIFKDSRSIMDNPTKYPYDIDGLIFTPAKLAVYSYYPSMPVEIKPDMTWNSVFKWKPPEQNTVDFLIKYISDVKKDGLKYRKFGLYVADKNLLKEYTIKNVLNIRYKYTNINDLNEYLEGTEKSVFKLFVPNKYYFTDNEFAYVPINTSGEVRAENNDKIESDTIVEFRYDIVEKRWIPIRLRADKTRIHNKGIYDKTANSLQVALDTWDTIHNMISAETIVGNGEKIEDVVVDDNILETDDVYYERNLPFIKISGSMLGFHRLINSHLYNKPNKFKNEHNRDTRGNLLEIACGKGGDLINWKNSGYSFVLGIDLVKSNIYSPKGCYSKLIFEHKKQLASNETKGKNYSLINMAFAVGDCTLDIKTGEAAIDPESKELLKLVMNPIQKRKNLEPYERVLVGKCKDKFNAISCLYAIHYFFESETKLEQFLHNVSDNLRKDGLFFATLMDGSAVEAELNKSSNGIVEGRKDFDEYSVPVWAIIKKYTDENHYNKKIDVFIENTQKLITEFLVDFNFLVRKAKQFNLELVDTELFSETFEKTKKDFEEDASSVIYKNKYNLHEPWRISEYKNDLKEFNSNDLSKTFSFFYRWVTFKKV